MQILNFLLSMLATKAFAKTTYKIDNPLSVDSIAELVNKLLTLVYQVGLPLIIVMIVYSGFLYVTARGNKDQVSKAHEAIKWTLIGTAIVLGASVIAMIIEGTITNLGA